MSLTPKQLALIRFVHKEPAIRGVVLEMPGKFFVVESTVHVGRGRRHVIGVNNPLPALGEPLDPSYRQLDRMILESEDILTPGIGHWYLWSESPAEHVAAVVTAMIEVTEETGMMPVRMGEKDQVYWPAVLATMLAKTGSSGPGG